MGAEQIKVGDAVTWNDLGKRLFGDTKTVGIVMSIIDDHAEVQWESGQATDPTLNVLALVEGHNGE